MLSVLQCLCCVTVRHTSTANTLLLVNIMHLKNIIANTILYPKFTTVQSVDLGWMCRFMYDILSLFKSLEKQRK